MADLQTFTAKVLARKEEELTQLLEEAKAQEEAKLTNGLASIAEKEASEKEKIDKDFQLEESIAEQRIQNQKRNTILASRQEKLLAVFDKAYEKMQAWDAETFGNFVNDVLKTLDANKTYQLSLGELSQHSLTLPSNVTLSNETIPNEAGFVLETEGIRYNYLFRALLGDMSQDMLGRLSKQLED